jgi:hypothetical protein
MSRRIANASFVTSMAIQRQSCSRQRCGGLPRRSAGLADVGLLTNRRNADNVGRFEIQWAGDFVSPIPPGVLDLLSLFVGRISWWRRQAGEGFLNCLGIATAAAALATSAPSRLGRRTYPGLLS